MEFSGNLLFFFSALGAFNGLLLGFYFLLFAKPKDLTNRFLGLLILMLSIRVGKSVFFYFKPDLAFDYLQLGLTACFFIGPFLYFYIKRLTQPQSNIDKEWKYHLLILIPFAIWFGYTYPFEEYVDFWRPGVIQNIYHVWIGYILLSIYTARDSFKKILNRSSKWNQLDTWVTTLILGNLLLVSIYYTMHFTFYISGALSFSFLIYLSWAYLYFNRENRVLYISEQKKYGDQKIKKPEVLKMKSTLEKLMEEEKIYNEAGLKLPDVAQKIKTNPHKLSQFLNEHLNKSFTQFINEYRVSEAKALILSNDHLTLEGIGYEVGFSSRSTFYASFKKYTGVTPATYRKKAQIESI